MTKRRGHRAKTSSENPTAAAENPSASAEGAMASPAGPMASVESPTAAAGSPSASAESAMASPAGPMASAESPLASVEGPKASVEGPFVALAASHGTVFEAMTRGVEACTKAGLLYQDALLRFAASRLEGDSKNWRALFTCKNWAEAAEIQRDWASSTAQDYVEEVGHLVQLTSRITAPWMASPRADASPAKGSGESHA